MNNINTERLENIADKMISTFENEMAHDLLAGFGVVLLRIIRDKPEARNAILGIMKQVMAIVEKESEKL